jgi:hypothetical protein
MTIDLLAARDFMATHARVLDRRRFELLDGETDPSGALAALDGYRNPDGGYGWGLEGDLRSPESQPAAALHAFEVLEQVAPATVPQAAALCDWLDPWLERATRYCLGAIAALDRAPFAYVLAFSVQFLDAVHDSHREADELLRRLGRHIPADGRVRVRGGAADEALHPLDIAPYPGRPARRLFASDLVAADLDRLAALQQPDGGWIVDFTSSSPAGSLDWRGYATVRAIDVLRRNAVIDAAGSPVLEPSPAA